MITINDINKVYVKLKTDIKKELDKSNIARAIKLMDTYADFAQRINNIFRDDEIEGFIDFISDKYKKDNNKHFPINNKKIIFYDQIGTTICLGLQYIRGLIANGYEILYIFENPFYEVNQNLIKELENNNIPYYLFNSNINSNEKLIELGNYIRKIIQDFNPTNLMVHSPAYGAFGCSILNSLKGIKRYRIVPGDHHFYLGYNCIDYFIEFRNFGLKTAIEQRKIDVSKLFKLPYYPIIDEFNKFRGFPVDINNKIIFASAGAPYKFQGSSKFLYFVKWLLQNNKNIIFFYIGRIPSSFISFVKEERLEDKFIFIGYRKDFVNVIKSIDVLIDSYPFQGGLVCQTAAYLKKPIISFSVEGESFNRSVRSLLGSEEFGTPISFSDGEKLKKYVTHLISDINFRKVEGERIHDMLQTKTNFDKQLELILSGNLKQKFNLSNIEDYSIEKPIDYYINLQNNFKPSILEPLVRNYGISLVFKMPWLIPFINSNKKYFITKLLVYYSKKYLPIKFQLKLKEALRSKLPKLAY